MFLTNFFNVTVKMAKTVTMNAFTVLPKCKKCKYQVESGSIEIIMKQVYNSTYTVKAKRCLKYRVVVLLKDKPVHFSCFEGPDEEQQKVDPHHTVVFGGGDCVKFQNKVSFLQ